MELKHVSEYFEENENVVEASKMVIEAIEKLVKEIKEDVPESFTSQYLLRDRILEMVEELETSVREYFTDIVEMEIDDQDEFDYALDHLYDWGDCALDNEWPTAKMCWINSF